mmetsp:Transcript_17094/g.2827  ORF Transcript_17094/g.2827 Transcript_17094/m.2827 type:complete len:84 (-) Transcript_17094:1129-1380(-)
MTNFIGSLLPTLTALLRDDNLVVRQTASWTLSRTCEFYYKIISHPHNFNSVLPVLLEKLQDDSKVACHACWGIINLVESGQEI